MLRAVLLLAVVAALLAGCGDSAPDAETTTGGSAHAPRATDLAGRRFVATKVRGRTLVPGSEVTIELEAKRLHANAGCNGLVGAWSIEDGRLRLHGRPAQTMIGCEHALMRQDEWLSDLLEGTPRIALHGAALTLAGDGATMRLRERAPTGPRPIAGTRWRLESIGERDGTASSVPAAVDAPTLLIRPAGGVELFAGCNQGGGHAQVREDGFVVFGPLALTRTACKGDAGQVEAAVRAVLEGEVAAAFDGEGNLMLARRGTHLTFSPVG
jgi:heat shock protein HslJ